MCASRYDRAITVFSPDGQLLQVEYAQEAVNKGSTVVAVQGNDVIVFAVEKRSLCELQIQRSASKIFSLDKHIFMTFAGFTADARAVVHSAQLECQSHKMLVEDPAPLEHISRFIATLKQKYTQNNGTRPFAVSCLIAGFNDDGTAHLFQTAPSGVYYKCKANVAGRSSEAVRKFLVKQYTDMQVETEPGTVKLALQALLQVLRPSPKTIEVAVMRRGCPFEVLSETKVAEYMSMIEEEKAAEEQKCNKFKK